MDLLYSGKPPSTSYLSDSSDHDYYFFFNEIPKLGQMFLLLFPFLGVLGSDYSYGFPGHGVTFTVDFRASLSA